MHLQIVVGAWVEFSTFNSALHRASTIGQTQSSCSSKKTKNSFSCSEMLSSRVVCVLRTNDCCSSDIWTGAQGRVRDAPNNGSVESMVGREISLLCVSGGTLLGIELHPNAHWSRHWFAITHVEPSKHVQNVALLIKLNGARCTIACHTHAQAPSQLTLVSERVVFL